MNTILISGYELLFLGVLTKRGESTLSSLSREYAAITEKLSATDFPSVFIIAEALKKSDLIKTVKSTSSRLSRYQITPEGTSAMNSNIKRFVTDSKENSDDFKIALSLADLFNNDEMIELLTIRKNNLMKRFDTLRKVPSEIKEQKYFYKSLYKFPRQVIELETKFINEIINELKNENEIQLQFIIRD